MTAADMDKHYILLKKIYLLEGLTLSVVWRWEEFSLDSTSRRSGTSLWLGVTLLQCLSAMTGKLTASLNLTAPVNCHSQCLITALLLSAINFVVIEGHRLCIEGIFSISSVAKIVDLWLQSFEAPALLQLPRKALPVMS